jgi:hypothetical protein
MIECKHDRMYDSVRWRRVAKIHLNAYPLCVPCLKRGLEIPATIVHHNPPHEGVYERFWDSSTFESVCASCHSGILRVAEHHGYSQSCGLDGFPIDANHPFNK